MHAHLDVPSHLRDGFTAAGVSPAEPGAATVASAPLGLADWQTTLDALTALYRTAKAAASQGSPIVFVVSADALLGQTGPLDAMAATGVVSAARTLAAELRKQGVPVNCLASADDTPTDEVVTWALRLLEAGPSGPTGELLQLGGAQIGKALS